MPGKHQTGIQTMALSQVVRTARSANMEWQKQGGEVGEEQGICNAQRLESQPASGTLMTIMSCHTSCRASQQILPLSLPFSDQCY